MSFSATLTFAFCASRLYITSRIDIWGQREKEKKFAERADKQSQWVAFLRKTHLFDISENFSTIIKDNRIFLYPVAKATEKEERFEKEWPPGGPWQS
jgi:hypothetical protein